MLGALVWGYWQWRVVQAALVAKMPEPVLLDSLMLFPAGSAELRPEATKVLINIKAQPNCLIVITGHSDNSGNSHQNLELSQARAVAVREWIQRMGDIPHELFRRSRYGGQPVAQNDMQVGRAANRRVDIRLVPQQGACLVDRASDVIVN